MDDRTEFQTDRPVPGVPSGGPARRWFYQRLFAATSFACICCWPLMLWANPELEDVTVHWFMVHGGVVASWMGASAYKARQ